MPHQPKNQTGMALLFVFGAVALLIGVSAAINKMNKKYTTGKFDIDGAEKKAEAEFSGVNGKKQKE